ncbi:hypothetical protein DCAR_0622757 [Daucus carota subsp. sativus]|uniref:Uncharacterized protein n=1 Tax=Daucus carota subsp. sativus TaxID=79200 RepID=A0A161ZS55_DAUCS|nr:hypothetical protein DCAR_0622757 [Daucus carota subsp. sativus]
MKALVPHISFCPELTGKYSHTDVYMFTLLLSHFTYNFVHTPISFFSMLDANESADAPSSFVFLWFQIQNSNSYPLIGFKRIQISSLFISKLSNLASQPAPILGVFVKIWGTFCLRVCCEWNCGGGRRRGGDNGRQKDEVFKL